MPLLTKSKYMIGLSCPKYLWMMFHDIDKIPHEDLATEYRMNQGKIIGQLAKKLFPNGINLKENDFNLNLKQTIAYLKQRRTIFEAGIMTGDIYSRADILIPVNKDQWDIIEVKASTKVKDENIHDVSFQKHTYESAGLNIRKCFLLHINSQYVKNGGIDPDKLFKQQEITADVEKAQIGIQDRINSMMSIVNSKEAPKVRIGNGCNNGFDCASEDCWSFLPEGHVFELYRGGKKSFELLEAEIFSIKDIPDKYKLNGKQEIQKKCAISGKTHINKDGIKEFINSLTYPLHYLDFETFQTAIPIYTGTTPYQQIPFQFSLHIDDGKKVKHFEYLHDSQEDPRETFLKEMKAMIQPEGSIIIFSKSFETRILQDCAEAFPAYKDWVSFIIKRMVDLIEPFRNFDYYNAAQKGSCSIKEVLPAITGKSYKELNIGSGGMASVSYYEAVFNGVGNKEQIKNDLLAYCKLDTEGMVWIVDALRKLIK